MEVESKGTGGQGVKSTIWDDDTPKEYRKWKWKIKEQPS